MEDREQDDDKDRDTPDAVREDLIRLVAFGEFLPFLGVLVMICRREIGGDILVSRIRDDRLEVGPEGIVLEGRLELLHHFDELGVHFGLDLVHFGELDGVKERRFDALCAQGNIDVLHKVRDGRIFKHRFALPPLLGDGDRLIHQFLDPRALERGNGDDGQPDLLLQELGVDDVARLFHRVHHVERDDDGDVDLHELRGQIEVALEVGRIDDIDDARGLFIEDEVTRDDFLRCIGRE